MMRTYPLLDERSKQKPQLFAEFGSKRARRSQPENLLTARPRGDNLKNALRFQEVEHLLHGGSGIQQADPAFSIARRIAQGDQRAEAAAIHERRPGQIDFDDIMPVQGSKNPFPEFAGGGGGQYPGSGDAQNPFPVFRSTAGLGYRAQTSPLTGLCVNRRSEQLSRRTSNGLGHCHFYCEG